MSHSSKKSVHIPLSEATEKAKAFVYEFGADSQTNPIIVFQKFECIDDREKTGEQRAKVPGAGLGILMDVLASISLLKSEGKIPENLSRQEISDIVSEVLGQMTLHTDDVSASNPEAHDCVGCGHCNGALKNPSNYLLTSDDVSFFNEYLTHLRNRSVKPSVYSGEHDASAVFILEDTSIGLPADLGNGMQAYVYHKGWHHESLRHIAKRLFEKFSNIFKTVDHENLFNTFKDTSEKRLMVTVSHLCPEHPFYLVSRDENKNIVVSQLR